MERYHIFKLGLAILFYAVYCIRPMMVNGLKTEDSSKAADKEGNDFDDHYVFYQGVQGKPGVDFPVLSYIPRTSFSCRTMDSGYYADLDTDCQVFHICEEGKKISFLCPNGTIFQQAELICEWWFKVNCTNSPGLYEESAEQLREDSARRKASRRVAVNGANNFGAVMRTEEHATVSASRKGKDFEIVSKPQKVSKKTYPESGNRIENHSADYRPRTKTDYRTTSKTTESYVKPGTNLAFDNKRTSKSPNNYAEPAINQSPDYRATSKRLENSAEPGTNHSPDHLRPRSKSANSYSNHASDDRTTSQIPKSYAEPGTNHSPVYRTTSRTPNNYAESLTNHSPNYRTTSKISNNYAEPSTNQPPTRKTQNRQSTVSQEVLQRPRGDRRYQGDEERQNNFEKVVVDRQESPQSQIADGENQYVNIRVNHKVLKKPKQENGLVNSGAGEENSQFVNIRVGDGRKPSEKNSEDNSGGRLQVNLSSGQSAVAISGGASKSSQDKSPTRLQLSLSTGQKVPTVVKYGGTEAPNVVNQDNLENKFSANQQFNVGAGQGQQQSSAEGTGNLNGPESDNSSQTEKNVSKFNVEGKNGGEKQRGTLTLNDIVNKRLEPSDSDESQIPQETASFYKNSFNSIQNTYKTSTPNNHRETYSDLKEPKYYSTKILSAISSVTPQYLTTQPINNGRPFIGSQVGTTLKIVPSTQSPRVVPESSAGAIRNPGYPLPLSTIEPPFVSSHLQELSAPSVATYNNGQGFSTLSPNRIETSTKRVIDHATVYGKFVKDSTSSIEASTSIPIRPVPSTRFSESFTDFKTSTSTPSPLLSTTTKKDLDFNNRYFPSRSGFDSSSFRKNGQDVTLDKDVSSKLYYTSTPTSVEFRPSAVDASKQNSGFYVTKNSLFATSAPKSDTNYSFNSGTTPKVNRGEEVVKPRPFQISTRASSYLPTVTPTIDQRFGTTESTDSNSVTPTYPTYKISSASPFTAPIHVSEDEPTVPTPLERTQTGLPTTFENIDSMINALAEMANANDHSGETSRPGLVIPPSAGPQTLHTLAVYFANALDGIAAEKDEEEEEEEGDLTRLELEKKRLTALLTQMTMNRYNELFTSNEEQDTVETTTVIANRNGENDDNDLEAQHSKNPAQTPRVRQLAKVFTQALSSYLDDPATFKRVLQEVRPTEPPGPEQETTEEDLGDDELLNFSDADAKSSYPPIYPTAPSVRPTWGYLIALNNTPQKLDVRSSFSSLDVRNSLNPESENLQLADSQSFVSQFNKLKVKEEKESTTKSADLLGIPGGHWTTSPGATKLWKTTFSFDPASINDNFGAETTTVATPENPDIQYDLREDPHHDIQYDLRALPKLALNSTQVHGILIDFMNTTKTEESGRLQRILRKLNTTEDEFLSKMKEIETNPLTRRLILLLISECGTNATKEIETEAVPIHSLLNRTIRKNQDEVLETSSSIGGFGFRGNPVRETSSNFEKTVDPSLGEHSEDTRALQLLNSLYTIASKFGK